MRRAVSFISGAMYSYADLTGPGALGLLGRALDADPDLRPSRLDTKVPPRRRVESSAEVMAEAEAAGFAKDLHLWWRDSGAGGEGSLNARQHMWAPQNVHFGIKEDWLRDEEHRERLAAWILGVVDAHDSYVGDVYWTTATNDHLVDLVVSHRRRARRADVQLSNGTGSTNESRYLWPHMWLIYLGPSYVHRFGKDKVSRLWGPAGLERQRRGAGVELPGPVPARARREDEPGLPLRPVVDRRPRPEHCHP